MAEATFYGLCPWLDRILLHGRYEVVPSRDEAMVS